MYSPHINFHTSVSHGPENKSIRHESFFMFKWQITRKVYVQTTK